MKISVIDILPNPDQPRTVFDQAELEVLAQSIREHGVILPIAVEKAGDKYILIDGERRWRAAKLAGLKEINADVKPSSNHRGLERLTKALVANVQRSQMGPVDEGRAFQRLLNELGTLEKVADKVGVSIATVSTKLALLEFPEAVQKIFNLKRLTVDGKIIAALKRLNAEQQIHVVTTGATRGFSSTSLKRYITKIEKNLPALVGKKRGPKPKAKVIGTPEKFSALAMVKQKLPEELRAGAIATCKACPLYDDASPVVCRQCPLPDFLSRVEIKQ